MAGPKPEQTVTIQTKANQTPQLLPDVKDEVTALDLARERDSFALETRLAQEERAHEIEDD